MTSKLSTLANMIAGRKQRRVKTVVAMPAIYWTCSFLRKNQRNKQQRRKKQQCNGNQVDAALAGGESVDCVCPHPIQVVPSRTGLDTRLM